MSNLYERRTANGVIRSADPAEVFPNWKGADERWLFLAPHDDDIILGAGLTFLAALSDGIHVEAAVTTMGDSGYCSPEERYNISEVRGKEVEDSFGALGLPRERLHFLNYHDCGLEHYTGHFPAARSVGPTVIEGSTGLDNSYVWLFRKVRPTRIFVPSVTDIHPDHQTVNREALICIFHASGTIWPELGAPTGDELPALYEYATYSDFLTPPDYRTTVPEELLEKKLAGIATFKSQSQIGALIDIQRKAGCREYIRTVEIPFIVPGKYDALFDEA